MPLIIVTGLPTSGKSTRARQLEAYIKGRIGSQKQQQQTQMQTQTQTQSQKNPPQQQGQQPQQQPQQQQQQPRYRLHLISDQTQSIPRSAYDLSAEGQAAHTRSANAAEKDARAALYGAVKRALGPRDIVVLDGLNYIKGWRYQLFCEAKNVRTPSCVLQVGCAVDRAREVNERRLERRKSKEARNKEGGSGVRTSSDAGATADVDADAARATSAGASGVGEHENSYTYDGDDLEEPYEPANWENLVFRYEEPNPMTRWDSPLFTLIWEDDEARTRAVFDSLWDAIAGDGRKVVRPNQATVQRVKDPGGDYLYMLERETQDIVKKILELQGDEGGGDVRISRLASDTAGASAGEDLVVELPGKKVGLPQLQRYRRAFVGLNRGGIGLEALGSLAAGRLRESFVGYLNGAFENDE